MNAVDKRSLPRNASPPTGVKAEPPTGMKAEPPTGMKAEPPTGMKAEPPTDMKAEPPTGAKAEPPTGMEAEGYRALMRHQAGAVTVIATGQPGTRAGLTATAVASLSDNPPTILACVQRKASAHDIIVSSGVFSVNLLTTAQQDIAETFAGRRGARGEARFLAGTWATLASGAPVLVGALAVLDCRLVDRHDFTTHSIFIGRVLAGRWDEKGEPLLYFRNDFWDLTGR